MVSNCSGAMETFGNMSCSSSICINLARSDGYEHPLHLAKVTKCTISSRKLQICTAAYVSVARCAKLRGRSRGAHGTIGTMVNPPLHAQTNFGKAAFSAVYQLLPTSSTIFTNNCKNVEITKRNLMRTK